MNSFTSSVKRKDLEEERIAICPQFSCKYIKRVKPLKFKFFGFGKYPKCKKHHLPLVFIDEFIGRFLTGVNACMFDISSLPPEDLLDQIKKEDPNGLISFVNLWMYSNPFGRGIDLVSRYFDGLSNAYMKVLNRKQRKELNSNSDKKDRYGMLRQGMQRLVKEYTLYLKEFRFKSEELVETLDLEPLSNTSNFILQDWMKLNLKKISNIKFETEAENNLKLKYRYDMVLNLRTTSLLISKTQTEFQSDLFTIEIFSAYSGFFQQGLTKDVNKKDIEQMLSLLQTKSITSHFGFAKIRDSISVIVFQDILNDLDEFEILENLKYKVRDNLSSIKDLTSDELDLLNHILIYQASDFDKFFGDLIKFIKFIHVSYSIHKKIKARIIIKHLARDLYEQDINFSLDFVYFYDYVIDIYNILKLNFPYFFSINEYSRKGLTLKEGYEKEAEYRRIVGSRIKIYIIKNIYNGLYSKKEIGKCPECKKSGFKLNTDISKLKALELHHTKSRKERNYSANRLYHMFRTNRNNPNFLENLINLMESKKVILLCGNHHDIHSYKYFNFFKHLISWRNIPNNFPKDIFLLTSELIFTIIRICVDSHPKTKDFDYRKKDNVRVEIAKLLKKRYIIESIYGEKCHICGEFDTKNHLTSFQFNHVDEKNKSIKPSRISKHLSCSDIVEILKKEDGGFICSNCHTVLHNKKYLRVLDKIYDSKEIIRKVKYNYEMAIKKFTPISKINFKLENPLDKPKKVTDSLYTYLTAVWECSKLKKEVSNHDLTTYLGYSSGNTVKKYFRRNFDLIRNYVKITQEGNKPLYKITERGILAVQMMNYFKEYYSSI